MSKGKSKKNHSFLITGPSIGLCPLTLDYVSEEYLGWLNDPEVQKFTDRHNKVFTWEDMTNYVKEANKSNSIIPMCIIIKESNKHIGNISLQKLDRTNGSVELAMMIGDKNFWGMAYSLEAIELATELVFNALKLHRLWGGTINPAVNLCFKRLNWLQEGEKREAIKRGKKYVDVQEWSLLNFEWHKQIKTSKGKNDTLSKVM